MSQLLAQRGAFIALGAVGLSLGAAWAWQTLNVRTKRPPALQESCHVPTKKSRSRNRAKRQKASKSSEAQGAPGATACALGDAELTPSAVVAEARQTDASPMHEAPRKELHDSGKVTSQDELSTALETEAMEVEETLSVDSSALEPLQSFSGAVGSSCFQSSPEGDSCEDPTSGGEWIAVERKQRRRRPPPAAVEVGEDVAASPPPAPECASVSVDATTKGNSPAETDSPTALCRTGTTGSATISESPAESSEATRVDEPKKEKRPKKKKRPKEPAAPPAGPAEPLSVDPSTASAESWYISEADALAIAAATEEDDLGSTSCSCSESPHLAASEQPAENEWVEARPRRRRGKQPAAAETSDS